MFAPLGVPHIMEAEPQAVISSKAGDTKSLPILLNMMEGWS